VFLFACHLSSMIAEAILVLFTTDPNNRIMINGSVQTELIMRG